MELKGDKATIEIKADGLSNLRCKLPVVSAVSEKEIIIMGGITE